MPDADVPPPLPPDAQLLAGREIRRPLRFSLRSLLGLTGLLAVVFAAAVALPAGFSQLIVGAIWIAASGWLTIGLIYGRGDERAFAIGAALVVASMWTGLGGRFMQGVHEVLALVSLGGGRGMVAWIDLLFLSIAAVANGVLCVAAKRYYEGK